MKIKRIGIVGAALFLGLLIATGGQEPASGKKYALLVGINEYQGLPNLKYAENDVQELKKVLEVQGYQVQVIAGAKAVKKTIETELTATLEKCKKNDLLILAFAGHGMQFDQDKEAYFCPHDGRAFATQAKTLVSLNWVMGQLEENCFAQAKVMLVDACRNNPDTTRGKRGIDGSRDLAPAKGIAAMFSCSANEVAYELDELKHGLFFYHVLEGMRGKATNSSGKVTFNSLADYVTDRVSAKQKDQNPHQKSNLTGGSPVFAAAVPFREPLEPKNIVESKTPRVVMETNHGRITLELDAEKAPDTVRNFLQYLDDKYYDGTTFHRVIAEFMIQGGGYEPGMKLKKTRAPIKNEATGLSNQRGTIAMARTSDPDSANAQFFINVVDNKFLDRANFTDKVGYTVFGKVIEGMEVVDQIRRVNTGTQAGLADVPAADVIIQSVRRTGK